MKKRIANEKKDNEEAVSKRLKYQWKALNEKVERLEDRLNNSTYAKDTVFEKDSFVKTDVFNTVLKRMIKSFDERFENVESTFEKMTDDILDMEKVAMKAAADAARLSNEKCRNSEFHEFEEKLKAENVLVEKRIRNMADKIMGAQIDSAGKIEAKMFEKMLMIEDNLEQRLLLGFQDHQPYPQKRHKNQR